MKKIYYLLSLTVLALFSACQDYNTKNFPGFDQAAVPTNQASYKYTLTSSDYTTISNNLKKPINDLYADSISKKNNELKLALTKVDSTRIKLQIDSLNLRLKNNPINVKALAIATNKIFVDSAQFITSIPIILNTKYPFADPKSLTEVAFNLSYDTTKIATANKYTLVNPTDYTVMGSNTGFPGKSFYFSVDIDPTFYIPIWLKDNNHYAKAGDLKLIRYRYFASNVITQKATVFIFDGSNWITYNASSETSAKFKLKDNVWQFSNSDIFMGLVDGIGDFKTVSVLGDQVWAWNSYKYMMMTGYVAPNYFTNEDWLISPPLNFTDRTTPWVTFMHVGRYFGDTGTSTDKMHKALTLWVSTTSDGTSVKAEDWTQLTIPDAGYPSGAAWTLITSTPISLAKYAGKNNVRIAFKYLSNGADKAAGTWEVKNFSVFEQ